MRDNEWLENAMYELWEENFVDIPRKNRVIIKFGKKSYRQLGCIKWAKEDTRGLKKLLPKYFGYDDKRISLILITDYFKDISIPDEVVKATIAHEMCHYAHGFNSPLQQLFNHPHKGGVIRKELYSRNLGQMYKDANKWLKQNWANYIRESKKRK